MKQPTSPDGVSIIEMDAMDELEWDNDQHTPVAPDGSLTALVRQTAPTPPSASAHVVPGDAVTAAKLKVVTTVAKPTPLPAAKS
ncbi:MAG: hypothetical protein M3680_07325, partial [Myxococcota bacterium]|nr:hypothetical protein [Myxococcota bacterium]